MTAMTFTTSPNDNTPPNSYLDGRFDGELAAATGLPHNRIRARASMAEPYDPDYASGLTDGWLDYTIPVQITDLARKIGDTQ